MDKKDIKLEMREVLDNAEIGFEALEQCIHTLTNWLADYYAGQDLDLASQLTDKELKGVAAEFIADWVKEQAR